MSSWWVTTLIDDLKIGDHVSREGYEAGDPPRLGTIVKVYASSSNGLGKADTLSAVEWNTGTTVRGYLRVGLTRLPTPPAAPKKFDVHERLVKASWEK